MITIRGIKAEAEFPKSLAETLGGLNIKSAVPLISGLQREYRDKLGVAGARAPAEPSADLAAGEIYVSKSGDFFYYKLSCDRRLLECGSIQRSPESPDSDSFFDAVKTCAEKEMKADGLSWQPVTSEERWAEMISKGTSLKPPPAEISAAKSLEDPAAARFLQRVLSSAGGLTRDAAAPEDAEASESLAHRGLLAKEFAVLCKEKGQQILRVNSRDAVLETSGKGVKCFLCGKPIAEESVEEILSATDLGRKMLEKGYWALVRVREIFGKLSPADRLVSDHDELPGLLAYGAGEVVLIGVFDRKLSVGEAYLLNAKLALSRAGLGIIVGLQGISPLLSEFLRESNPDRRLHFFESMSGLEEKMGDILERRQREKVREIMAPFSSLTRIPLRDMICEKVFAAVSEEAAAVSEKPKSSRRGAPAP